MLDLKNKCEETRFSYLFLCLIYRRQNIYFDQRELTRHLGIFSFLIFYLYWIHAIESTIGMIVWKMKKLCTVMPANTPKIFPGKEIPYRPGFKNQLICTGKTAKLFGSFFLITLDKRPLVSFVSRPKYI